MRISFSNVGCLSLIIVDLQEFWCCLNPWNFFLIVHIFCFNISRFNSLVLMWQNLIFNVDIKIDNANLLFSYIYIHTESSADFCEIFLSAIAAVSILYNSETLPKSTCNAYIIAKYKLHISACKFNHANCLIQITLCKSTNANWLMQITSCKSHYAYCIM